jgi:hypothetical protein
VSFIIISLLVYSGILFSQDTIVLADNKKVIANVSEVSPSQIRYKRFDMPDGPVFTENLSNIQSIHYKNGVVDHFNKNVSVLKSAPEIEENYDFVQIDKKTYTYNGRPAGVNKMNKVMSRKNDRELNAALVKMNASKRRQYLGFGALPAAGVAFYGLVYGSITEDSGYGNSTISNVFYGAAAVGAVAIVGFTATGIIFSKKYQKHKMEAVKLYNEKF